MDSPRVVAVAVLQPNFSATPVDDELGLLGLSQFAAGPDRVGLGTKIRDALATLNRPFLARRDHMHTAG